MSLSLKVRLWIKIRTMTSSFTLGMRSEGDTPKSEETKVGFFFMTVLRKWLVLVKDFLVKNNVETLEDPTYSSDLAAADFYFFLD